VRKGFTIVELLVVISIIALLIGLLLPALGKARDSARLHQSSSNLRQVGAAHLMYASEWNDRQFQLSRDDFGAFGNNLQEYFASQGSYNIPLGWAQGFQWIGGLPRTGYFWTNGASKSASSTRESCACLTAGCRITW
jgi:prepilin-type N-terminal cleavage/methylation domain-containing protein